MISMMTEALLYSPLYLTDFKSSECVTSCLLLSFTRENLQRIIDDLQLSNLDFSFLFFNQLQNVTHILIRKKLIYSIFCSKIYMFSQNYSTQNEWTLIKILVNSSKYSLSHSLTIDRVLKCSINIIRFLTQQKYTIF